MEEITKLKHVFITGTGTGVGKSIFAAFLALLLHSEGKKVALSKPIQTGSPKDTDFLKDITNNKIPIFNSYSFTLPASPFVAAEYENKVIEKEKIVSDIRKLESKFDCVIVEGIGGVAVPIKIANRQSSIFVCVADLIKDLNYPVIIVARPTLGTINHTILTIEFAKQKGLNILGFVISGYDEKTNDPVICTAPEIISDITGVKCLMKLPLIKEINYGSLVARAASFSSNAPSCLAKL